MERNHENKENVATVWKMEWSFGGSGRAAGERPVALKVSY